MAPLIDASAPVIIDPVAEHTETIFFLHGGGEDASQYVNAVHHWQKKGRLDGVKFVLPNGPLVTSSSATNSAPAYNWLNLNSLPSVDSEHPSQAEIRASAIASRDYIESLVQEEIAIGIPSERIILAGFSQGGAVAILAGLTSKVKIAGIVGMSTWLLFGSKIRDHVPTENVNDSTPIMLGHRTGDHVIRHNLAKDSRDLLSGMGYNVDLRSYVGTKHSMSTEELDEVELFLENSLSSELS